MAKTQLCAVSVQTSINLVTSSKTGLIILIGDGVTRKFVDTSFSLMLYMSIPFDGRHVTTIPEEYFKIKGGTTQFGGLTLPSTG